MEINLSTVWPSDVTSAAEVANQFLLAWDSPNQQGTYLLIGHLASPAWATPEQARRGAEELNGEIAVDPKGSFFLARDRAEELWVALGQHLGHIERG